MTIPLWTANDESGGKAIIIIDDPSPRDTLRSPSIPPPRHRFYLPTLPYRSRGCDCGKTVSIFSSPRPTDCTDGKFPNEFIAFLRSVPYTVHGNLLYFVLSKNDTSSQHLTRGCHHHPLCYSSPHPTVPKAATNVITAAAAIARQGRKRRYYIHKSYAWRVLATPSRTGSGNRTFPLFLFFVFTIRWLSTFTG